MLVPKLSQPNSKTGIIIKKVFKMNEEELKRIKEINKMLKRIKSKRSPFIVYGKILKIKLSHALLFLDIFIPSFKLLSLYAIKYCPNKEIIRISIKKEVK